MDILVINAALLKIARVRVENEWLRIRAVNFVFSSPELKAQGELL